MVTFANLTAGRSTKYGVWLAAVGELKGRPGTMIWDMGYGMKWLACWLGFERGTCFSEVRRLNHCATSAASFASFALSTLLFALQGMAARTLVAFAWDSHDRQARPSSFRVGPCTAASSAWRSCCLVFATLFLDLQKGLQHEGCNGGYNKYNHWERLAHPRGSVSSHL